ncbi:MAG: aminopeptidase [Polyangiaceae bacterium]|nr:aminopeptidase [Polyangiaceae bacterium]
MGQKKTRRELSFVYTITLLSTLLLGCGAPGYLFQAAQGQLDLMCRARPIERAIDDENTPPRVRKLLSVVPSIKRFGTGYGLSPTSSYETYVALGRSRVVYVTTASDPLAFKPRKWRFPIVGTVPYLGWFDLEDARRYADDLAAEGLDVDVRGATAYSTLGWFRDPVLSSMLGDGPTTLPGLVDVVLHESVHATLYIPGQSTFNESLAEYVSDGLTEEYLREEGLIAELIAYRQSRVESAKRRRRMHDAYKELESLYASSKTKEEKLEEKKKILTALKEELGWKRTLNNATLLESRTYGSESPAFATLFERCGTWERFWKAMRELEPEWFAGDQSARFESVLVKAGEKSCAR